VTKREQVDAFADTTGIQLQVMDGFDDAILGVVERFNDHFVLYDQAKVLEILMKRDGMEELEAQEFHEYNQLGAWVGDGTPAFLLVLEDGLESEESTDE